MKKAPRNNFFHNKDGGRQKSSLVSSADVYPIFPTYILNSSTALPCDNVKNAGGEKKSYNVCIIHCKEKTNSEERCNIFKRVKSCIGHDRRGLPMAVQTSGGKTCLEQMCQNTAGRRIFVCQEFRS